MRDYGVDGQIGLEPTLEEYHTRLLEVTAECMRVLKPTGVMFWNMGDSYASSGGASRHKGYSDPKYPNGRTGEFDDPATCPQGNIQPKSLFMQNERLIIRMIDEQGWILRNRIAWVKPNSMPSSAIDRFSNKYEPVYMLTKNSRYWFDLDAVRKPYTKPLNRWGGQKLKANGKSEWDDGTGQESYRDRDMRPNPLGKNPGDVVEMTQVEWMNYCHDIWDLFADEHGDVMKIPTYPFKGSHFATFPPSLVDPLIKAACPAEICPVCGMARERLTESTTSERNDKVVPSTVSAVKVSRAGDSHHTTIGWTDCGCSARYQPGVVLDPFCGAGTTLLTARDLGRSAIGIEISADYCDIIKQRVGFNQTTIDGSIEYVYKVVK